MIGRPSRAALWLSIPLIAAAYYAAALLGLSLAYDHDNVSPVWPPTGVAIAALFLFGYRQWPAVLIGAFAANAWVTPAGVGLSAIIAGGNTLEAVAAAWMMHRLCGGERLFDRPSGIARYILIAAPSAVLISASIGVVALEAFGAMTGSEFVDLWLTWWLGDLVGAVVVAPLLIVWLSAAPSRYGRAQWLEAIAMVAVTAGVGAIVFGGVFPTVFDEEVLGFLAIPPIVWAGYRFGPHGATLIAALIAVFAIGGTLEEHGPFFRGEISNALKVVQAFTGVITVTGLMLAASSHQERRSQQTLRDSEQRHRALNEAGSDVIWTFEPGAGYADERGVHWWEAVTGQSVSDAAHGGWLKAVHEDDRERVAAVWCSARAAKRPYEVEYRVCTRSGDTRHVIASTVPILEPNGDVREWCGTLTDITARRRAEELQQQAHSRLDLALRAGGMGAWEWDVITDQVTWSTQLEEIHGLKPGSFGGTMEDFKRDIHTDDLPRVIDSVHRAVQTGGAMQHEYRIVRPDGVIAWVEGRGYVFRNAQGRVIRMTGVCMDITARKQSQRRLAAEHAITRVLGEGRDFNTVAIHVIRELCDALGGHIGALWLPSDGETAATRLACEVVWHTHSIDETKWRPFIHATQTLQFSAGEGLPGKTWSARSVINIADLAAPDYQRRALAADAGLVSGFAFPITDGQDALGVIEIYSRHKFQIDESMVQMVLAIGRDMAQFLQRQRAEAALRASEARERSRAAELQSIIDAIPAVVWMAHDTECRRVTGNRASAEFLQLPAGANPSKTADPTERPLHFRVLKDGQEVANADLPLQRVARTGVPVYNEALDVEFEDGSVKHELGNVIPLFNEHGQVRGALAAFMDLTPVKRVEQQLQLHLTRLQLVYQVTNSVTRAADVTEIFKQSLSGLMSTLSADRASVLLCDEAGVMRFRAWEGLSDDYRAAVEGHSPWNCDDRDPQPVTIENVGDRQDLGHLREVVLKEGIQALAFIPLISNHRLLGKFMVYFNHPHKLSADELQLAQTIAGHVAFAMERVSAEAQLRESEQLARRRLGELGAIYRDAPVGLCFLDPNLRFVKANDRLAAVHGRTGKDLIGRGVEELSSASMELIELMRLAIRDGQQVSRELQMPTFAEPNVNRDWLATYEPVKDGAGHLIGVNGMLQDITDRKRTERELQFHRSRLEELVAQRTAELERTHQKLRHTERMASMGTLAAGLGHDMGNLLLPVRSRLDVLRTLPLGPAGTEHLDAIEHCVKYLNDLVRGLRLFARDPEESGGNEPTNLCDWSRQTYPFYNGILPRNINLAIEVESNLPPAAIPPHALTQAILNLVNNARDAIGNQAGRLKIHARLLPGTKEPTIALSVYDDGPGMTSEIRARAAEPFFTTKTRSLSTGLGLAMVYGLVGSAGGSLEIHSPPREMFEHGTEITLLIPAAPAPANHPSADDLPRIQAAISVNDPRARALLTTLLANMGYKVIPNANGHPGEASTIWFTEPRPEQLEAAQDFVKVSDRKLVIVGEVPPDWHSLTPQCIDASCKPSAVRAVLQSS